MSAQYLCADYAGFIESSYTGTHLLTKQPNQSTYGNSISIDTYVLWYISKVLKILNRNVNIPFLTTSIEVYETPALLSWNLLGCKYPLAKTRKLALGHKAANRVLLANF